MTSKAPLGAPQRLARRTFLAGAVSLPLLPTDASPTRAETSAELLALISRHNEEKALVDTLDARVQHLWAIEDQHTPVPPAALCRRKADSRLLSWFYGRGDVPPLGEPYSRNAAAVLSRHHFKRVRDVGTELIAEPWPLAQARAGAIVAARKEWDEACNALRQRLGLPDLEEALDDAYVALWDTEDEIQAFPPRSMADLRLKASFALDHMFCDESAQHGSDVFAWNLLRELVEA